MRKWIVIIAVIIIVGIAGIAFVLLRSGPSSAEQNSAAPASTSTSISSSTTSEPSLPILATIVAVNGGSDLTIQMQGTTTTETVMLAPTTLAFQNGKSIKPTALKAKEMVAVVLYPASVGANVAQDITVVSQ